MKTLPALLVLLLLPITANSADEKSPDEIYAERLAAADRKGRTQPQKGKTWEQRAQEELDAYRARHEAALRKESPAARAKREEAERAAEKTRVEEARLDEEDPGRITRRVQEEEARMASARASQLAYIEELARRQEEMRATQAAAAAQAQANRLNEQVRVEAENWQHARWLALQREQVGAEEEEQQARQQRRKLALQGEQMRAEEEDRQHARRVVDQMQSNLLMGHSREQLKTDLFMANGSSGPKTRQVVDQMQSNLLMGHSREQLKTDLFMLHP